MKFYLIEIATYNNGQKDSKGIYEYETLEEAIASFHKRMGGAMGNADYESDLCIVINSEGGIHKNEVWHRYHEPEPTPEVEE